MIEIDSSTHLPCSRPELNQQQWDAHCRNLPKMSKVQCNINSWIEIHILYCFVPFFFLKRHKVKENLAKKKFFKLTIKNIELMLLCRYPQWRQEVPGVNFWKQPLLPWVGSSWKDGQSIPEVMFITTPSSIRHNGKIPVWTCPQIIKDDRMTEFSTLQH